ncbi:porin family protein [uncultured Bacteroides sp.]|mgnify:CR=1 FL=1|uniref:porin family protein n=1 Tax=uncultured Bacteroides sp. TaxID=162156 RepID=UPI00262A749E|nr:porin family protein [uncultured Bacteroides sp.]
MKKIFSTLVIMVCLLLAVPAQAQVKFGIKGGLDMSKVTTEIGDNATGFFVGPMMEATLPIVGLGVDVAALYSQSGVKLEGNDADKLKSIEVPVNLKWTLGLGSTLGVFAAVGPQFGFNLDNGVDAVLKSKKCAVSVNVGVGLKLLRHLQLGVNYNIGASKMTSKYFENLEEVIETEPNFRKNSWQVSLAYMF